MSAEARGARRLAVVVVVAFAVTLGVGAILGHGHRARPQVSCLQPCEGQPRLRAVWPVISIAVHEAKRQEAFDRVAEERALKRQEQRRERDCVRHLGRGACELLAEAAGPQ